MAIKHINVERCSVTTSKPFREVIRVFDVAVGHPEMNTFRENVAAAKTPAELEKIVRAAIGPHEFMEFTRFDLGDVLRKRYGAEARQSLRLVLGNPLIMSQMVEQVPDAGSYAPVTILIDERQDGVHLTYDRMASFLAPYGNADALKVARELDSKVEALLEVAAREKREGS